MLFAEALAELREQVAACAADLVAQGFGGLLELRKIVAVGFEQVADALDRVGFVTAVAAAVGELGSDQRLAAAGLGVGRIQPLQRMSHARAQLGEIAQLLLRHVEAAEQRVGKHLVQLGEEAVLVGGGEIAEIKVIGLGQPEQKLRGDRALVALYQVDITGRNAETLGDLGLREIELLADAPEARTDEQFFGLVFSGFERGRALRHGVLRLVGAPAHTQSSSPGLTGRFSTRGGTGAANASDTEYWMPRFRGA